MNAVNAVLWWTGAVWWGFIGVVLLLTVIAMTMSRYAERKLQEAAVTETEQALREFGCDLDEELRELFRKRGERG